MDWPVRKSFGFTLIELLLVITLISLVCAILVPVLARARAQAKSVCCINNLKQLGFAFVCYADDYDGYTMPACDAMTDTYWWGRKAEDAIEHRFGFIWPYLRSELEKSGVYECPSQPYGSYRPQGKSPSVPDGPEWITSTYGYNGYYLCSPMSGWVNIRNRPWQKITTVEGPEKVIAFCDAMLDRDGTADGVFLTNSALLDPPFILTSGGWKKNLYPTTCFRHSDKVNVVFVDAHCKAMEREDSQYVSQAARIGSIGEDNRPYYVPDWKSWPVGGRHRRQ